MRIFAHSDSIRQEFHNPQGGWVQWSIYELPTGLWKFSSARKQWKNNRIDLREGIVKQVASQKFVVFVLFYNSLPVRLNKGKSLLADDLYLSDLYHHLIANVVKPRISELCI